MAKQYRVVIRGANESEVKTIDVVQRAGDAGAPVLIQAVPGAKYELQELNRDKQTAPEYVKVRRKGKNLYITFEDGSEPDVVIEDYYGSDAQGLIGEAESGLYYDYIPEDPNPDGLVSMLIDDAPAVNVALGGYEVTPFGLPFVSGINPWPWLLGGALLAGGAAAAAGGGGGNSNANSNPAPAANEPLDGDEPPALLLDNEPPPLKSAPPPSLGQMPITGLLAEESDTGVLNDNLTKINTPTLTGTMPTNATAKLLINGQEYDVEVDGLGNWWFTQPEGLPLPDGTYYPVLLVTENGQTTPHDLIPFTIDTTPPSIIVTSSAIALATGQTAKITFTLSEVSADFDLSDVEVAGGTLSGFAQDPINPLVYTATFVPDADGNIGTIRVASDKFQDAAGNFNNDGAEPNNQVRLTLNATVTGGLSAEDDDNNDGIENAQDSDNTTTQSMPALVGTVPEGSTAVLFIKDAEGNVVGQGPAVVNPDGTWLFTQPSDLPDGTYYPEIVVTPDGSNTPNPPASLTPFTVDTTPPTVVVSTPTNALIAGESVDVTFTFSEPVSGFELEDVLVAGGTLSNLQPSPTNPLIYTATFTPSEGATEAEISVPADAFMDAAGNTNPVSNQVDLDTDATVSGYLSPESDNTTGVPNDAITNDSTPTLEGKLPVGATATVLIKDEQGNVVGEGPATVNPDGTWRFTQPDDLEDGIYFPEVVVTPEGSDTPDEPVQLAPFTIDTTPPMIAITADTTELLAGQGTLVTFTLSEPSIDFTEADVAVMGGRLSGFEQSPTDPKVYTALFTPDENAQEMSIEVASGVFSDVAGNLNQDGDDADNRIQLVVVPGPFGPLDITDETDSGADDLLTNNGHPVLTFTGEPGLTDCDQWSGW
jgi:large repetitive protein